MTEAWLIPIVVLVIAAGIYILLHYYGGLWLQAYSTGAHIRLLSLVAMSLRRVDPQIIVQCRITTAQAGLADIPTEAIEAQYLAGGNVQRVTLALVAADRAGIELGWDTAAAVDLAGRDILEAVQVSVNPKVIDCPDPHAGRGNTLSGVARDGIQLRVRVRVTVQTNFSQLIGGATESTVIARVGEGIVSAIGGCERYQDALADPGVITRQVLEAGLDSQSAFAIVSIDIANIDVGNNIGAQLQIDQAEADIRIAVAVAEQRRALAVARLQEMVALTTQHQATVVLAESQIPAAVAAAYRKGQIAGNHPFHARDSNSSKRLMIPMRQPPSRPNIHNPFVSASVIQGT